MTYQQLLITMCCSVGVIHDFFYIKRVEMSDIEELTYVSLPPPPPPPPRDAELYYGYNYYIFLWK